MNLASFTPSLNVPAQVGRVQLSGIHKEVVVYAVGYSNAGKIYVARTKNCLRILTPTELDAVEHDNTLVRMPYYDAMACLAFRTLSKQQRDYLLQNYRLPPTYLTPEEETLNASQATTI